MPKPFFQRLQLEPIHVAFEDIVPAASTAARVQQRAVYKDLLDPSVSIECYPITRCGPEAHSDIAAIFFGSLIVVRRFSPRKAGRPCPIPDRRASDARYCEATVGSP